MLIRDSEWNNIRDQFTEAEKQELRKADAGLVLCPPSTLLDEHLLSAEMAQKVNAELQAVRV